MKKLSAISLKGNIRQCVSHFWSAGAETVLVCCAELYMN